MKNALLNTPSVLTLYTTCISRRKSPRKAPIFNTPRVLVRPFLRFRLIHHVYTLKDYQAVGALLLCAFKAPKALE